MISALDGEPLVGVGSVVAAMRDESPRLGSEGEAAMLGPMLAQMAPIFMGIQAGVVLGSLATGVMAISFGVAAQWLLPGVSPVTAAAIAFIGLIVNAIPITPGGIGVGEAAFEALFALVGVSGGARLLLSWRFGQLPFALLGAVYFARHREEMRPVMEDVAEYKRHAEHEQRV